MWKGQVKGGGEETRRDIQKVKVERRKIKQTPLPSLVGAPSTNESIHINSRCHLISPSTRKHRKNSFKAVVSNRPELLRNTNLKVLLGVPDFIK